MNFFQTALDLIHTDGVAELNRAKNKAYHFDHQSEQMSDISRNARKYADELEKAANENKKNAKQLKELTYNASELAKNSIDEQRGISDQIRTKIIPDFPAEQKKKVESLKKLSQDSFDKANTVYDESLTLFANVNAIQIPEPDLTPIKNNAQELSASAEEISKELDNSVNKHNELLDNLEQNIKLSDVLIKR